MKHYHCYEASEIARIFDVDIEDIRILFHENGQTFDLVDLDSFEDITLYEANLVLEDAKDEGKCSLNCENCKDETCEYRNYIKIASIGEKIIRAWIDGKVINPRFLIQWDY